MGFFSRSGMTFFLPEMTCPPSAFLPVDVAPAVHGWLISRGIGGPFSLTMYGFLEVFFPFPLPIKGYTGRVTFDLTCLRDGAR